MIVVPKVKLAGESVAVDVEGVPVPDTAIGTIDPLALLATVIAAGKTPELTGVKAT